MGGQRERLRSRCISGLPSRGSHPPSRVCSPHRRSCPNRGFSARRRGGRWGISLLDIRTPGVRTAQGSFFPRMTVRFQGSEMRDSDTRHPKGMTVIMMTINVEERGG